MNKPDPTLWVQTHLTRIAQSEFRILTEKGVVVIDPFLPIPGTLATLILITHPHPDHFNPRVIQSLSGPETRIVVPASMMARWGNLASDALSPGESRIIAGFSITAFPAYNVSKPFHPRSQGWVGYRVETGGLALYHAGDTDRIPEMDQVRADVALLPVGGLFTMNPSSAVEAARAVGASVVVPMHYGKIPFTRGSGRHFAQLWPRTVFL